MAKGSFAANRLTIEALRKLKDSQNRYLWQPSYDSGQPATLAGFPIYAFADMVSSMTQTGGALALTFADWANYYRIVQKTGLQILRDPYSAEGYVIFKTRQRVGGGVYNGFAGSTLVVQQS
jgi:HK97 family phage major capsid protein